MPANNDSYLPSVRWNSEEETDQLVYVETNEVFEQERSPIPLNSSASTFVMDVLRREHGRGRIATGTYKMQLVPVGQEVPPIPEDEAAFAKDYKPAIGVDLWNPKYGLGRLESTAAYVRAAVEKVWREYAREPEASQGMLPVIRFVGARRTSPPRFPNKTYYPPIIERVGFVPRERVPEFAAKERTVPLPVLVQNDSQLATAMRARLEAPRRETSAPKSKKTGRPSRLEDDLDDSLPDDDVEGV
jgi:hypothetical protein